MKNLHILLAATLSVPGALFFTSAASAQAPLYYFTNFNLAGGAGASTIVRGISSSGVVVGDYFSGNGSTNFTGTPGAFKTLHLGDVFVGPTAFGINAGGDVVGQDGGRGAFLLRSGAAFPVLLPQADSGVIAQTAFGINDSGTIVGRYIQDKTYATSGFVYDAGQFTRLNALGTPTETFATGINNDGLVVGYYAERSDGGSTHGFTYNTRSGSYSLLPDPSVAGFAFAQFLGINDNGSAVGYYQTTAGIQHGFLYDTATSAYTFLDDPNIAPGGSSLMQITGINDSGEIAGYFTNSANQQVGFIADTGAAPVPEASSVVSLGILLALGGVCAAKKRKVAA